MRAVATIKRVVLSLPYGGFVQTPAGVGQIGFGHGGGGGSGDGGDDNAGKRIIGGRVPASYACGVIIRFKTGRAIIAEHNTVPLRDFISEEVDEGIRFPSIYGPVARIAIVFRRKRVHERGGSEACHQIVTIVETQHIARVACRPPHAEVGGIGIQKKSGGQQTCVGPLHRIA
jgi:hypothetical protein